MAVGFLFRRKMDIKDVRELKIEHVDGAELPYRVEIIGEREEVFDTGVTLASALMRAFSVSGMFPDEQFPHRTEKELARFIFWNFHASWSWLRAISALENA
jgi:hypothetical protein